MEKMPEKRPLADEAAFGTENDWSALVGRAIETSRALSSLKLVLSRLR